MVGVEGRYVRQMRIIFSNPVSMRLLPPVFVGLNSLLLISVRE